MEGNELFGVDIAGVIGDAIGPAVLDVTITRAIRGARQAGNLTGGQPATPAAFECRGFWDDFTGTPPPGVMVELGDRKLVLIGDTVPDGGLPLLNDACTVHESGGDVTLYCVQRAGRDPAGAVYAFQCRDRRGPDGV